MVGQCGGMQIPFPSCSAVDQLPRRPNLIDSRGLLTGGQSTSAVGDQGQRSNAALAAVPLANHWLWTRDLAWLKQIGWPFLNEVALFFECYLPKYGTDHPGTPPNSYSSVNDCFNELCSSDPTIVNVNPHITMSLLRFLMPVFADAAKALQGISPQRQALWAHLHANLAPLPLVNLTENETIFGGVLGSTNHPPQGGNPLNVYLGWPDNLKWLDLTWVVRPMFCTGLNI